MDVVEAGAAQRLGQDGDVEVRVGSRPRDAADIGVLRLVE
jgi:hypothetical protein